MKNWNTCIAVILLFGFLSILINASPVKITLTSDITKIVSCDLHIDKCAEFCKNFNSEESSESSESSEKEEKDDKIDKEAKLFMENDLFNFPVGIYAGRIAEKKDFFLNNFLEIPILPPEYLTV